MTFTAIATSNYGKSQILIRGGAAATINGTLTIKKAGAWQPAAGDILATHEYGDITGRHPYLSVDFNDGIEWRFLNEKSGNVTNDITFKLYNPNISLASSVSVPIDVGESVTLTATPSTGKNLISSSAAYRWYSCVGSDGAVATLLSGTESTRSWQASGGGTQYYYCVLPDNNGDDVRSNIVSVTVNAASLSGTVDVIGDAKYGAELRVAVSGSNNTGTLSYQWKRGGTVIAGAIHDTYIPVEADLGQTLTCTVNSSVETGSITSQATLPTKKGDGPTAPTELSGVSPSTEGGSDGRITGTNADMEYSAASDFLRAENCSAGESVGFAAGTYYIRYKETSTHKAGAYAAVAVPVYAPVPAIKHSISVSAEPAVGGTISGGGEYTENTAVSLTAAPNTNYRFVKWTEGGSTISAANPYTFPATGSRTLVAVFETDTPTPPVPATKHSISVSAEPAVGGTISGGGEYTENTAVSLTAAPNANYRFVRWAEGGKTIGTTNPYTFPATGSRTLVAVFETNTPIPLSPSGGSVFLPNAEAFTGNLHGGSFIVNAKGDLVYTVQADCSRFVSLSLDGRMLTRDSDYTMTCGSTILTVKKSVIDALANGKHTLKAVFTNGIAQAVFTTPLSGMISGEGVIAVVAVPATGDMGVKAILMFMLSSALSIIALRKSEGISRMKNIADKTEQ